MACLQSHGFLLVISLLLLQAGDSSPHSAALAASGDSSSSATTPDSNRIQSPVANPPRLSPSPGNWVNVTSNLAGMASECGNMTYVSAKPNEDLVIAGIALKGLWGSTDGGTSWHQLGSGGGSAKITNRPGSIIYDPARPNVFWQSGIYNGNGIYRTDNNGKVFRALGSIGSCPLAWCSWRRVTAFAGRSRAGQLASAGRLTVGSSLNGAMVSSVM